MVQLEGSLHHADKLGTIIGDDTEIGTNVLVKAGMMISNNCKVNSGKKVQESLPENSTII